MPELGASSAEVDVPPPAAESGFDDDRRFKGGSPNSAIDLSGGGMREAGAVKQERGGDLVMARKDRRSTVEHADPSMLQAPEVPDRRLHTVQRLEHVDPPKHGVAAAHTSRPEAG